MKRRMVLLAVLLLVGVPALGLHAITVGFGVGYEITGLALVGALTEMPIGDFLDVRAQVGFATLQRFKGLESDAVILCEVQDDPLTCSPAHLYVGMSRAKHHLTVLRYR